MPFAAPDVVCTARCFGYGATRAHGVVQLAAKPLSADLTLDWKDVVLPQELAGQLLMSHGTLTAKGSP